MSKNVTVMGNYMMQKQIDTDKFFSGKVPETNSIIRFFQPQLHSIAETAMKAEATEENEAKYQSVISTVYTLIEDDRLPELFQTIKERFPEYFIA